MKPGIVGWPLNGWAVAWAATAWVGGRSIQKSPVFWGWPLPRVVGRPMKPGIVGVAAALCSVTLT